MAKVGFFGRLANLFRGFLSLFIKGLESKNPEYVYESAIEEQKERYQDLRSAAAGIMMLNKRLGKELEEKSTQLQEISHQVTTAVEQGDDEVALVLIQRKDELTVEVERLKGEFSKSEEELDRTKSALISFQGEIEKLQREKDSMLARKADAEARVRIHDALKGLSVESDMKALESVREGINRTIAQADMAAELEQSELSGRMAKIKKDAATVSARMQLDELKKQLAERKEKAGEKQAEGGGKSL